MSEGSASADEGSVEVELNRADEEDVSYTLESAELAPLLPLLTLLLAPESSSKDCWRAFCDGDEKGRDDPLSLENLDFSAVACFRSAANLAASSRGIRRKPSDGVASDGASTSSRALPEDLRRGNTLGSLTGI